MPIIPSNFKNILQCRLCKNKRIESFLNFGSIPLGNNLQTSSNLAQKVESYDLKVMNCKNCNHFQLSVSVSPKSLYATNYTYLSGIGSSFVEHIKEYVDWVINETKFLGNKVVVDIGSNDGTCLEVFQDKGFSVCGIDPAQIPAKIANSKGIFTVNKFFDKQVMNEIIYKFGKVDVVTSQNVLAHVDDLNGTFKNIYSLLKLDGFFVFEIK